MRKRNGMAMRRLMRRMRAEIEHAENRKRRWAGPYSE